MKTRILALFLFVVLLAASSRAISEEGLSREIYKDNTVLLQIAADTINIRLDNINTVDGTVLLTIGTRYTRIYSSKLAIHETKEYDTNKDNINDLSVRLDTIFGGKKAAFTFNEINAVKPVAQPVEEKAMAKEEPKPSTIEVTKPAAEPTPLQPITGEAVNIPESSNARLGWILLGIVVLIAIIAFVMTRKVS